MNDLKVARLSVLFFSVIAISLSVYAFFFEKADPPWCLVLKIVAAFIFVLAMTAIFKVSRSFGK